MDARITSAHDLPQIETPPQAAPRPAALLTGAAARPRQSPMKRTITIGKRWWPAS